MKKFYYFATVAIILIGCGKIEKAISNLELRMDAIEGTAISTVDKQITAISASLETLKSVDESLQGLIDILEKEDELAWLYPNMSEDERKEKLQRIKSEKALDVENRINDLVGGV